MKKLIDWGPRYSVGNALMDSQHEKLVSLCNDLAVISDEATNVHVAVNAIIEEMDKYARLHFASEEEFLRSIDYPDVHHQEMEHREFRKAVDKFMSALNENGLDEVIVHRFVTGWWQHHILKRDMEYRSFIEERKHTG